MHFFVKQKVLLLLPSSTMRPLLNLVFLFVSCLFISSCKKDNSLLGLEVQPAYDQLSANLSESQNLNMHTQRYDSIVSYNSSLKYLGSNQDPYFGRTDVGLYLNASLSVSNKTFAPGTQLTSAEIILEVSGTEYMGDAATQLTYSVFPIDSTLSVDRYYYTTNNRLHNTNTILATYTGSYTTLNGRVVLRIPVDTDYAKQIINNPQYLTDNATFQAKYKGYYITSEKSNLNPQSSQGIVSLFDLASDLSGFYLHYKETSTSIRDSTRFGFSGDGVVRYNTVKYQANQGGHYLLTSQLNGDTTKGNEDVFLKGLGNTLIKISIPGLKDKTDSFFVSVNRAEVIFNIDNNYKPATGKYNPPPILTLIPLDENGKESLGSHSYNVSNLDRYDGKYDATSNRYTFDIARFVHLVLNGKRKNYGFHLVVADPDLTKVIYRDVYMNRVVFYGINHLDLKPKCNLYYVKLKEG